MEKEVSKAAGKHVMSIAEKLIQEGRQEGMQQGMTEGAYKEKILIARNLLKSNASVELIAKVTGLLVRDLKDLR